MLGLLRTEKTPPRREPPMAKILILDDDPDVLHLLRTVLRNAGHHVQTGADGRIGIRHFERFKPDLVITDIVMPERDGMEVIVQMRAADPSLPIVAISGNAATDQGGYLRIAGRLGANRTLSKPFRPSELIEAVNELLPTVNVG